MPNHTPHDTTSVPTRPQPPARPGHIDLGRALVFLLAPFLAVGYHLAVTVLKIVDHGRE